MNGTLVAALAALAITAGSGTTTATAAPATGLKVRGCGVVASAGTRWVVVAAGVPCPSSRSLVKRLAARKPAPIPTASRRRYSSLNLGMACTWSTKGSRTLISCIALDGTKLVQAMRR